MCRPNDLTACKVGNGACHAQDSVVSSRGKPKTVKRLFEKLFGGRLELAVFANLCGREICIAEKILFARVSFVCKISRRIDPCANIGGSFGRRFRGIPCNFRIGKGGHFHLNIDSVKKRTADTGKITTDIGGRTGTFLGRMTIIPTFAGIHRANKHEIGRKRHLSADTSDGDLAVLERLTEYLHCLCGKFGKLIEEKHAVMRERDLARSGNLTTARKPRGRHRMMRRAERTLGEK